MLGHRPLTAGLIDGARFSCPTNSGQWPSVLLGRSSRTALIPDIWSVRRYLTMTSDDARVLLSRAREPPPDAPSGILSMELGGYDPAPAAPPSTFLRPRIACAHSSA